MSLTEDLQLLAGQLMPESCPRCAQAGQGGFCQACRDEFARVRSPCHRCGLPGPCHPCPAAAAGWQVDQILAPFIYTPPLSGLIQALKYRRQRHLGRILGELLAAAIGEPRSADIIVPVPLHRRRLRERHFNQADEIARPLARRLRIPLRPALIARRSTGAPQAGLDRDRRWQGVQGAFAVRRRIVAAHAVIVDDVVTTGATVNAVAAALKAAGVARVSVWAVARALDGVPGRHQPAAKI